MPFGRPQIDNFDVWVEIGGMLEESQDSSEQLSVSLGISLISIIVLLVIQYNGWAKPMIILATLPLAPSMVVIAAPCASSTASWHDRVGTPST